EEFECFAAAVPHLVSMLIAHEGDPDAPCIPTPRSYAEAIAGEYSSQWQTAMDVEMASWKSTGTYVDEVPPPGANIVSGMWIFRVKRPPGPPPVFKAWYVAQGFSQREGVDFFQTFSPTPKMTTLRVLLHVAAQRDYELHSLDLSTAFLQGSLHEEIWLRRPPGFTGSFPPGTQWSLWRPVYGLRQAPREWHDTLRTTLAALGFSSSTADPSLFLRTDTSVPPFYILVYVDDLVFATADTEALAHVKSELQKRHTCTDLGELTSYLGLRITRDRARRTITLTQSHMVQQVLQRFGFTWSSAQATPLAIGHSLSALPSDESYIGHGARAWREALSCSHWHSDASWVDDQATQRSSQGYTFSLGSSSVSWRSTRSSSVLSSSCEAEIYATAMAAQELCWLTYLLTDLGERPSSPPVLYVDNKAAIALCQEHRLEHRTKHIALRYFLARELQQRGQLCLRYVATQANTADIFTKALQLACFVFLDLSCDPLLSPTLPMGFNHFFIMTTPTPSSASTATTASPATSSSAVAAPLARSRRSADRLGANKVDSSSRGNGGQKRNGRAPLKEGGTRVTTGGSYSGNTSLYCKEAFLKEFNVAGVTSAEVRNEEQQQASSSSSATRLSDAARQGSAARQGDSAGRRGSAARLGREVRLDSAARPGDALTRGEAEEGPGEAEAGLRQVRGRAGAGPQKIRGRAGAGLRQIWGRAGAEPGQGQGRAGAGPGQDRSRAGAGPKQGRDRAGARPRQVRDRAATGPGRGRGRAGTGPGLGQVRNGAGAGPGPGRDKRQGEGQGGAATGSQWATRQGRNGAATGRLRATGKGRGGVATGPLRGPPTGRKGAS
ncbi:unnamed protein product, partial [Closterium sp. NIES-53]